MFQTPVFQISWIAFSNTTKVYKNCLHSLFIAICNIVNGLSQIMMTSPMPEGDGIIDFFNVFQHRISAYLTTSNTLNTY